MDRPEAPQHNAPESRDRRQPPMNLKLRVGEEVATVALLEDRAPKVCATVISPMNP